MLSSIVWQQCVSSELSVLMLVYMFAIMEWMSREVVWMYVVVVCVMMYTHICMK